jgi:tetratricopeptide (TPR) repeat protein
MKYIERILLPLGIAGLGVLGAAAVSCAAAGVSEEALARYARASGAYGEGRFGEAAELLAGMGAFPPALVLRGKAEYFSGETGGAEKSFRGALKRRPGAAEASLYLARILRERGRAEEAEGLVEEILGDDPSDIRALRLAAELSLDRGPPGEAAALAFLDRAAEASSEAALVFLDRARLRWIAGKGEAALEDLGKARALLAPGSPLSRAVEGLESVIKEFLP